MRQCQRVRSHQAPEQEADEGDEDRPMGCRLTVHVSLFEGRVRVRLPEQPLKRGLHAAFEGVGAVLRRAFVDVPVDDLPELLDLT